MAKVLEPTKSAKAALLLLLLGAVAGCGGAQVSDEPSEQADDLASRTCSAQSPLRIHFYAVGQGLSALVDLPDGRHILVDTGDDPTHSVCGASCGRYHQHIVDALTRDLAGAPIDLLWITHQHIDHAGGAADIIRRFRVLHYVDNGRAWVAPVIAAARAAASSTGAQLHVVDPSDRLSPLPDSKTVKLTPIVPRTFVKGCNSDENECSIGLRIDACGGSVIFMGDAELEEEALMVVSHATVLQLGHHGSDTSSGPALLKRVSPRYAVVSAGLPDEGMNRTYCHPRASTLSNVTAALGGPGSSTITGFDAQVQCGSDTPANWPAVRTSDRLFATERDGDVVLATTGRELFARQ
jgi:competence protein ComEC